jgi:manganese/iron transport system ATP-binding protein
MISVKLLTKNPILTLSAMNVFRNDFCAVKDVNLEFEAGELVALSGRNGAGKSSLLLAIAGLTSFSGNLKFKESECHHGHHQPGIGYVPQRANLRWDLPMRAIDVVLTGTTGDHHLAGYRNGKKRERLAWEALEQVEGVHLGDRLLSTLSGGQAQRILIARSLVSNPEVLLLDEPLSGLDAPSSQRILELLKCRALEGTLIIAAMHELDIVQGNFSRAVLLAGEVIGDGLPKHVIPSLYVTPIDAEISA